MAKPEPTDHELLKAIQRDVASVANILKLYFVLSIIGALLIFFTSYANTTPY